MKLSKAAIELIEKALDTGHACRVHNGRPVIGGNGGVVEIQVLPKNMITAKTPFPLFMADENEPSIIRVQVDKRDFEFITVAEFPARYSHKIWLDGLLLHSEDNSEMSGMTGYFPG
jgi:hypothetical protein